MTQVEVTIPAKHHNSLIGSKGRLIRSVMDECGGVSIKFPPEGSQSTKVLIRGPKDDVDKAKKQLMELANEKVQLRNLGMVLALIGVFLFLESLTLWNRKYFCSLK